MERVKLIVDQYLMRFFRLLKKITVKYFTKFTNASYERILFNFNDFTITKMVEVPWAGVQRECGLKLFGLAFLREEILS